MTTYVNLFDANTNVHIGMYRFPGVPRVGEVCSIMVRNQKGRQRYMVKQVVWLDADDPVQLLVEHV